MTTKIQAIEWDERRQLIVPGDHTITVSFCGEHFILLAQEAIRNKGSFIVALSGGSTPKAIFERLAISPYRKEIDWSKVHLFWSDERAVLPTDPESNFHMAMESGLKQLSIPASQIHRMVAESDIEANAKRYEQKIKEVLKGKPFDLIMLGMGDDGHTASLFPDTPGLAVTDKLVIAQFIPQKKTWRMTLTFECINHHASHIVIYVLGASKKHMLATILDKNPSPPLLPAQRLGTPSCKALWIADDAAYTQR